MSFEQKERTRKEPKQEGENDFNFYGSAAGADYDQYRAGRVTCAACAPHGS
jgi:hypothetical protein